MRSKRKPKRLVIISDAHCGHITGLTPPEYQAQSTGANNKFSRAQKELWDHYSRILDELQPIDILVANGDMIDGKGDRGGGTEILFADRLAQVDMAVECIKESRCKQIVMTYGTPYHTGDGEDYEAIIAQKVGAKKIGGHEWLDVNGCVFDFKHKTGSSGIPHGRNNSIAKERLWNVLWHEHDEQPKADVIVRSHVHYAAYCGEPGSWLALTTPALQAKGTKYGVRQCSGTVHWGLTHFDIDENGGYTWQSHLVRLKAQQSKAIRF